MRPIEYRSPNVRRLGIALVAVVGLIAGGVFLLSRNQGKKNIAAALPPFVIDRAPARGEEQATEAPITIAFSRKMAANPAARSWPNPISMF